VRKDLYWNNLQVVKVCRPFQDQYVRVLFIHDVDKLFPWLMGNTDPLTGFKTILIGYFMQGPTQLTGG
jgi:hypothetical protein